MTDSQLEHRDQRDRRLLQSIKSGAGVRLVTIVFTMLSVSATVRSLGDSAFGMVATLGAVIGLAGFADLGLGLGLMTRLAQTQGEDDGKLIKPLISSALASLSAIGVSIAILGTASVFILPWNLILGSPDVTDSTITVSMLIFVLSIALAIPASIGQRVLLGTQRGAIANAWILAASGAQFGAVIAAAWLESPAWLFVAATITIPVVVSCVQSAWVLTRTSQLRPGRSHVSRAVVRHLVHIGGLFFALNLAIAAAYQSDTLVVSAVLGASSAAIFAVALRMFGALSGFFGSSLQQFWPALAESLTRGDLLWTRRRFKQVLILSTSLLAVLAACVAAFGQSVARIWVGESLVPPHGLLVAMAIWTVYAHVMSQISTLLNAGRVVAPQVAMATAMTCVNLPLSIILTMHIGLAGPVVGSLLAHIVCNGSPAVFFVRRLLREGIRE